MTIQEFIDHWEESHGQPKPQLLSELNQALQTHVRLHEADKGVRSFDQVLDHEHCKVHSSGYGWLTWVDKLPRDLDLEPSKTGNPNRETP